MTTRFIIVRTGCSWHASPVGKGNYREGEILKLVREPDNPVDVNAVALYNDTGSEKMAYLGWAGAKRVALLMQHTNVLKKHNLMAIVTGNWEVVELDQGPKQNM